MTALDDREVPVAARWVFDDGGRAAAGLGTDPVGDCTIRGIAIATATPYAEVLAYFRETTARNYRHAPEPAPDPGLTGPPYFMTNTYMRRRGWTWTLTGGSRSKVDIYLGEDPLPAGRVLVLLGDDALGDVGHVVAVIDGVVHDIWDSTGLRIRGYFTPPTGGAR